MKHTFGVKEVETVFAATLRHDKWYLLRISHKLQKGPVQEPKKETLPITYFYCTINTGNLRTSSSASTMFHNTICNTNLPQHYSRYHFGPTS